MDTFRQVWVAQSPGPECAGHENRVICHRALIDLLVYRKAVPMWQFKTRLSLRNEGLEARPFVRSEVRNSPVPIRCREGNLSIFAVCAVIRCCGPGRSTQCGTNCLRRSAFLRSASIFDFGPKSHELVAKRRGPLSRGNGSGRYCEDLGSRITFGDPLLSCLSLHLPRTECQSNTDDVRVYTSLAHPGMFGDRLELKRSLAGLQ